jgi:carbamate kinase
MLVVIALGRNALLPRGEPLNAETHRAAVRFAAQSVAPVAAEHQLVIAHGSGPSAGSAAGGNESLAVTRASDERSLSYMLQQELVNLLPVDRPFAALLTTVEVDSRDPAFRAPTEPVGRPYSRDEAERLAAETSWTLKPEKEQWRRVVAAPEPKRILERHPIQWLLRHNTIVIATGGAGIPVMYEPGADRRLVAVDCLIDRDLASELLARELDADVLVMLTDVDAVYVNWGRTGQAAVRRASPRSLQSFFFADGSMGPKVRAACRFAEATGRRAAIGSLGDVTRILAGDAGTTITTREDRVVFAPPPRMTNAS